LQSLKEILKYLKLPCFVTSKSRRIEEVDLECDVVVVVVVVAVAVAAVFVGEGD